MVRDMCCYVPRNGENPTSHIPGLLVDGYEAGYDILVVFRVCVRVGAVIGRLPLYFKLGV